MLMDYCHMGSLLEQIDNDCQCASAIISTLCLGMFNFSRFCSVGSLRAVIPQRRQCVRAFC